jgi:hypothetical protein
MDGILKEKAINAVPHESGLAMAEPSRPHFPASTFKMQGFIPLQHKHSPSIFMGYMSSPIPPFDLNFNSLGSHQTFSNRNDGYRITHTRRN